MNQATRVCVYKVSSDGFLGSQVFIYSAELFSDQRQERMAVAHRRRSAPPLPAATRQHLFYTTDTICIPKTQKGYSMGSLPRLRR